MGNFLRLTIDEYAIPAYCSSHKYMFGSLEHMEKFVDGLRTMQKCTPLIEAFDKYLAGDKKVKYDVAYNPMQMMHDCICFNEREGSINDFEYLFVNIWGFDYIFHADEFSFKRVMIQYKNQIIVAIMPSFKNLIIKGDDVRSDVAILNQHWGFPGIYTYDPVTDINKTNLFLVERIFDKNNHDDVLKAREFFDGNEFDLKTCFEEIVADG